MKLIPVSILWLCFCLAACSNNKESQTEQSANAETSSEKPTEEASNEESSFSWQYKLGENANTFEKEADAMSVTLKEETLEDGDGKKFTHTKLTFTRADYGKGFSFQISIVDKNASKTLDGSYKTNNESFEAGKAENLCSMMIVNTNNATDSYNLASGGVAVVKFDGKNLKISLKGVKAKSLSSDKIVPLDFEVDAKNVKLRTE